MKQFKIIYKNNLLTLNLSHIKIPFSKKYKISKTSLSKQHYIFIILKNYISLK